MTLVAAVLGHLGDPAFAGCELDELLLTAAEAGQPRVRRVSEAGVEVLLALPRGTFLRDGDVLLRSGESVVVVRRRPEPALVVQLPADPRAALALGHLLGNQHSPVDVVDREVRVPLVTGADTALETAHRLGLVAEVRDVPLARYGWWQGGGHPS